MRAFVPHPCLSVAIRTTPSSSCETLNDNSGRTLVGPAETIEHDAVFDRFGAVFDRLGAVFDRKRRRNEAFEFDSNCQAPQRAWQFESNSNAKV